MRRGVITVALSLLTSSAAAGQASDTLPRISVLFIGNSYTYFNDLPRTLQTLALQRKQPVAIDVGGVLVGGATLKRHWTDSANIARNAIRNGKWNYVVLQEQSTTPLQFPDSMLVYGKRFAEEIRAAGSKPLLYLTWPRKNRPAAQDSLTRAYAALADAIGAQMVPVGPAWAQLDKLASGLELYAPDGSHPSPLGSFVGAVAFYRVLFAELPAPDNVIAFRAIPSLVAPWERIGAFRVPPRTADTVNRAVAAAFRTNSPN